MNEMLNNTKNNKRKPSILGVLITFDIGIIAAIFILLVIFFNSSIASLLSDSAADSMKARSDRIGINLLEALNYLESKPEIGSEEVFRRVYENIAGHALNELEYDQSMAVIVLNETDGVGGTRVDRDGIVDTRGLTEFADEKRKGKLLELRQLPDHLAACEGNVSLMQFKYYGLNYIGTLQLFEADDNWIILILGDRYGDFFSRLHNIRNVFLGFIGTVLVLVLLIKMLNTRSAAGEIRHIRNQLQKQGDAIQRDGIVKNTSNADLYEFLDTNDLAGSFNYLNGRIENLGTIIGGIADKELFRAALQDDESVLAPHEEKMAILFLDVEGFTGISEQYGSGAMNIINRIWNSVQSAIEENGGKLNKFMGDACLVVFPEDESNETPPSRRALDSAIRLFQDIPGLRDEFQAVFGFRVGLDYGTVVYGKTGSERKYELGVIGDPVNSAARFESLNKQYGTRLLISGEILENADIPRASPLEKGDGVLLRYSEDFFLFRIDSARPKGKSKPKDMYSLISGSVEKNNKFCLIGLETYYHYKLLKLHNDFLSTYERHIALWVDKKHDAGCQAWAGLAYSWALMAYKYNFSIAPIFVERFVTAENYLAFKRSPGSWIETRKIRVLPPNEKWLKTGYYELEK